MTQNTWNLPDPDLQADFYADVNSKRLVAFFVDVALVAILTVLAIPLTAFTGLFYFPFLFMLIDFVYRVTTLSSRSATLGMRLMAVEFRDSAGRKFETRLSCLHTLGFYLSMSLPIVQIGSVLLMLTGNRGQGLTDRVLKTVLINTRAKS